jgi:hypothetical protein
MDPTRPRSFAPVAPLRHALGPAAGCSTLMGVVGEEVTTGRTLGEDTRRKSEHGATALREEVTMERPPVPLRHVPGAPMAPWWSLRQGGEEARF